MGGSKKLLSCFMKIEVLSFHMLNEVLRALIINHSADVAARFSPDSLIFEWGYWFQKKKSNLFCMHGSKYGVLYFDRKLLYCETVPLITSHRCNSSFSSYRFAFTMYQLYTITFSYFNLFHFRITSCDR